MNLNHGTDRQIELEAHRCGRDLLVGRRQKPDPHDFDRVVDREKFDGEVARTLFRLPLVLGHEGGNWIFLVTKHTDARKPPDANIRILHVLEAQIRFERSYDLLARRLLIGVQE